MLTLLGFFLACRPADADGDTHVLLDTTGTTDSAAEESGDVPVPPSGPYGTHTFRVPAQANWVNTGLYLRAGQTAELSATGEWSVDGTTVGPAGKRALGEERGCTVGSLVARSGLRFEDAIQCIGEGATVTAASDDIVYVGMIVSTDLGETYGERLRLAGEIEVTVTSEGDTVPTVAMEDLERYDFDAVSSGWVELQSAHALVTIEAREVLADLDVARDSLATLDAIYEAEADMRGMTPYSGRRIRWYPDATISDWAYMLAGNPTRCDPSLMNGAQTQRILRSAEGPTDIWGFAHEMGHSFTLANGAWLYMYVNIESWPNLFTLRALETLGRTEDQPNYATYCDGRDDHLADPDYEALADDPFLQLCFLKSFESYGADFYDRFYEGMNGQSNDDLAWDGTDAAVWRYVRDRFDLAAGTDTTPVFEAWGVPLE